MNKHFDIQKRIDTLETSCNYETENVVNQNFFDDYEDYGIQHDHSEASVDQVANRVQRIEVNQSNATISQAESISKDPQ